MKEPTTLLFRPVGPQELELVRANGWRQWPPRLPEQPIFYPVTNEKYAVEIASQWNVEESGSGYVTRFRVRTSFMDRFDIQCVGAAHHTEWWIPAEDLDELNANIVGTIELVQAFGDDAVKPVVPVDEPPSSSGRLRVGFRGPANGWLALELEDEGVTGFEVTVSYTPNDFLTELVWALRSCAAGDGTYEAFAHTEPEVYEFGFARSAEQVSFAVTEKRAANVLFAFAGAPRQIVLPFWRALRRLEAEFAAVQWRGPFPTDDLAKLTAEVEALK